MARTLLPRLAACAAAALAGVAGPALLAGCGGEAREAGGRDAAVDPPGQPDAEPPRPDAAPMPCASLDIVFAIDNSGSMDDEQMAMGTVIFPAFAEALRKLAPAVQDFRVGVKDACSQLARFNIRGRTDYCFFEGGNPWIESTSEHLLEEFACVGEILGWGGCVGGEEPASAAAAALEPEWAGPGKPNEGFLREDSTLVVVAMTDEDEQPVPDRSADEVYARLVATRGDVDRMIFLAIAAESDTGCTGPYGTATAAPKLKQIAARFAADGRGVFWDICAGSFDEGLAKAMQVIKDACRCTSC